MRTSSLETQFDFLWLRLRPKELPLPVAEYRFAPPRRWRFDRAFVELKVGIELEGGVYVRGRHQRPEGFKADVEKYNAAALAGWLVLRFTADDLKQEPDRVVAQVVAAIGMRRAA